MITEDGYILTNYHVIDGANSIKVTFDDGKEYTATYVGGEEKNDIAVIKVDATGLTPVVIGKSSDMLVGEQVTTIGNPLGELTFSESTGIISALDRSITMSDGRQMNMIQTDCAITPATPAARCSTATARSSASFPPSIPPAAILPPPPWRAWASPSPWTMWPAWSLTW